MTDIAPGQVWEVFLAGEGRWSRTIVTKVEDGRVTLRHEGVLDFLTVDLDDMQPELFRPAAEATP